MEKIMGIFGKSKKEEEQENKNLFQREQNNMDETNSQLFLLKNFKVKQNIKYKTKNPNFSKNF